MNILNDWNEAIASGREVVIDRLPAKIAEHCELSGEDTSEIVSFLVNVTTPLEIKTALRTLRLLLEDKLILYVVDRRRAKAAIKRALQDPWAEVRYVAAETVWALADTSYMESLKEAFEQEKWQSLKDYMQEILKQLGYKKHRFRCPALRAATRMLIQLRERHRDHEDPINEPDGLSQSPVLHTWFALGAIESTWRASDCFEEQLLQRDREGKWSWQT